MFLLPTDQILFQHVSGNTAIFYALLYNNNGNYVAK